MSEKSLSLIENASEHRQPPSESFAEAFPIKTNDYAANCCKVHSIWFNPEIIISLSPVPPRVRIIYAYILQSVNTCVAGAELRGMRLIDAD